MANERSDDEIPELTAEWFRNAVQPRRRGNKRAVFVTDEIARRFGTDEELEEALRALLLAADHVKRAG